MGAGRSKPNSFRNAATVSVVADCPKTAWVKSPGSIEIELKITIETMNRVKIPKPSRFSIVLKTGCMTVNLIWFLKWIFQT